MELKNYLTLLRPQQWIKNGFIFLPMFFSGNMNNINSWINCFWAFVAFSFIASGIYCINDVHDKSIDATHPKKKTRPIASGLISIPAAMIISITLIGISYVTIFFGLKSTLYGALVIITTYFILNLAYSFQLKKYAIIDVFIIALGFVLRLVLGGVVCAIWLSPWIVCLTFLLTLFLAFAKRRDDVILHEKAGIVTRKNVLRYNSDFMNQTLGILAAITMVCYIIYSVSPDVEKRLGNHYIYRTSIFVLAGILRYLQVTIVEEKSGSPTKILLRDRFLQLCIVGWIMTFLLIIYI